MSQFHLRFRLLNRNKNMTEYLNPGRLPDVLALIQVLSFDEYAHRSEEQLREELQGVPCSAESWTAIGRKHREFFRVLPSGNNVVSLTCRHVSGKGGEARRVVPPDFTSKLMDTAIEIHDRQVRRSERWTVVFPLIASVSAALIALVGVFLQIYFKK